MGKLKEEKSGEERTRIMGSKEGGDRKCGVPAPVP